MSLSSADYLSQLHRLLNQHFNLAEIRTLCLNLNIDYESVAGEEKPSRIRELLLGLARKDRLPELLTEAIAQRPRTDWPPLPEDFQLPQSLQTGSMAVTQDFHVYGDVVHGDKIGRDKNIVGDVSGSAVVAVGEGARATVYQGLTVEEVADLVVELKNQDQPTVWNGRIPYLGLSAYQEADARYFFGRESLVEELLQRVQEANFITIAGPSGSGKSSIARAGLFHTLREGTAIEKSDRWLLATMQPKGDPFGQLARAMEKATKSTAVGDALQPQGKEYPTAETLLRHSQMHLEEENGRCLLLVDQFEELFTQTKDPEQRQAFIDLLTHASQEPESCFTVVISLRSDFVSNCASHEKLRELISRQFQLVGAMAPRDLAKAITLPALEVGAEIDAKLVAQIIADMKGSPDALPLMSFALRDLFESEKTKKGEPMDLTLPEYVQRGGLEKALEEHANKVFNNFTDEQRKIAKTIFSKLIEVGQGRVDTRRTAAFAELVPAGSSAEAVTRVLSDLADVRLVTTSDLAVVEGQPVTTSSQEATVTIAHEKMIDAWPWLRTLVDENRDLIALQNQINNDARRYAQDNDSGYLYRGGRLLEVEEKLDSLKPSLGAHSLQFVQASLTRRDEELEEAAASRQQEEELKSQKRIGRILRWATVVVGVLLIIAIISAFQAVSDRGEANDARATSVANAQLANESEMEARNAEATADVNAQMANESEMEAQNAEATAVFAQATSDVNAQLAIEAQATSDANARLASTSEAEVQQLKNDIQADQLAYGARTEIDKDPRLALGLAVAGFRLNQQPNTYASLAENLQTAYRLTLAGHEDWVNSAMFSPDGAMILTASEDGTARLWDLEGKGLTVFSGHEGWVRVAVFSPDGATILTASDYDGTARLWDLKGNQLVVLSSPRISSAVFSPDGATILTASWAGPARLWDLEGNELAVLSNLEERFYSAVFSPDGATILTVSFDGPVRLWDLEGNELAALVGHEDWVGSAVFSPDGTTILTVGNEDFTVRLWDLEGNQMMILSGLEDFVHLAVFSPNGATILTIGGGTARLWDLEGNELAVLIGHKSYIESAVFSPDGATILTASRDDTARLWDLKGDELAVLSSYAGSVNSAEFSPDGATILTASSDTAQLWDIAGDELVILTGHGDWVNSAMFSPDEAMILTASDDGTAHLWDLEGNELAVLVSHYPVNSAEFSPDGATILIASDDGTARLWDLEGNELVILSGHEDWVNSAVFSPDGATILTASDDGTARLWDLAGNALTILSGHDAFVVSAVFSPDGATILTGSWDDSARLWDLEGNELAVLSRRNNFPVNSVRFSPDGTMILTASNDGTAQLWDLAGNELAILSGHENRVSSAVFSPDGAMILTVSSDDTARLWDLAGNELAILNGHEDLVSSAVFSPDGAMILTASWDGTARLWPNYTVEYMVSEAYRRLPRGFTEEECQQYFRDDLAACPESKRQLFAPLVDYLTPEQQADWQTLDS